MEDDGQEPWERGENHSMLDCPPADSMEQLEPPVEEYMEEEQEEQVQEEPTATISPTAAAGPAADPAVLSDAPAVLPIADPQYTTPVRHWRVEPTALTPTPMVEKLMPKALKLRRLLERSTVPDDVCPKVIVSFVDLTLKFSCIQKSICPTTSSGGSMDSSSTIGCTSG